MHRQALSLTQEELRTLLLSLGCTVDLDSTLKTFPGSVHWHIKKQGEKSGTLEATWLTNGEAWLSVHANRQHPWIVEVLDHLS